MCVMNKCLPDAHHSCGMLAAVVGLKPIQQQIVEAVQFRGKFLIHIGTNPCLNTVPLVSGLEGALYTFMTMLTQLFNPPGAFKEVRKGTFQAEMNEPVPRLQLIRCTHCYKPTLMAFRAFVPRMLLPLGAIQWWVQITAAAFIITDMAL